MNRLMLVELGGRLDIGQDKLCAARATPLVFVDVPSDFDDQKCIFDLMRKKIDSLNDPKLDGLFEKMS